MRVRVDQCCRPMRPTTPPTCRSRVDQRLVRGTCGAITSTGVLGTYRSGPTATADTPHANAGDSDRGRGRGGQRRSNLRYTPRPPQPEETRESRAPVDSRLRPREGESQLRPGPDLAHGCPCFARDYSTIWLVAPRGTPPALRKRSRSQVLIRALACVGVGRRRPSSARVSIGCAERERLSNEPPSVNNVLYVVCCNIAYLSYPTLIASSRHLAWITCHPSAACPQVRGQRAQSRVRPMAAAPRRA